MCIVLATRIHVYEHVQSIYPSQDWKLNFEWACANFQILSLNINTMYSLQRNYIHYKQWLLIAPYSILLTVLPVTIKWIQVCTAVYNSYTLLATLWCILIAVTIMSDQNCRSDIRGQIQWWFKDKKYMYIVYWCHSPTYANHILQFHFQNDSLAHFNHQKNIQV